MTKTKEQLELEHIDKLKALEEKKEVKHQKEEEKEAKKVNVLADLRAKIDQVTSLSYGWVSAKDMDKRYSHYFYFYEDGIYQPFANDKIQKYCGEKYPMQPSGTTDEIIKRIANVNGEFLNIFDNGPDIITLNNCNLNLKTLQPQEFSHGVYNTKRISIKYDPDATCPNIDKFLKEVLLPNKGEGCTWNGDINSHDLPNEISAMYELLGFCLYRDYFIKKLFIWLGENDSGKTITKGLFEAFIGKENCHAAVLQSLAKDKFAKAELHTKMINISGELTSKTMKDLSVIKELVGHDMISAEKKFGGFFTYTNYAKLIFLANKLPRIPDDEMDYFISKVNITMFPNHFDVNDKNTDEHILDKLITPEELSGLLNKILPSLAMIYKLGFFTGQKTREETLLQWNANLDAVPTFAQEMLESSAIETIEKAEIYSKFKQWISTNGITYQKPENTFWKELHSCFGKETDWKRYIDDKLMVFGLTWKMP